MKFNLSTSPFIKWPGGKTSELELITENAPKNFARFFDPFLGGGSVLLAMPPEVDKFGNDVCYELIELFRILTTPISKLHDPLLAVLNVWNDISVASENAQMIMESFKDSSSKLPSISLRNSSTYPEIQNLLDETQITFSVQLSKKLMRTKKVQEQKGHLLSEADLEKTIQGVLKGCFYYSVRKQYNHLRLENTKNIWRVIYFYLLRELAYASMFRFNSRGEFNVPYGGITYNEKNIKDKIQEFIHNAEIYNFGNTHFHNLDFKEFLGQYKFSSKDFIFVDPPYDTQFSSYDNRPFVERDQSELADTLRTKRAKIMILIGDSPLIRSLYKDSTWNILETDKLYLWNIKSRNDGRTKHLLIRNYLD